jgi:hypothetical protein
MTTPCDLKGAFMPKSCTPSTAEAERIEVAIAALAAATRISANEGGAAIYPPDLFQRSPLPRELRGYTREEVEAASQLLVRLGYLESPMRSEPTATVAA